MHVIDQQLLDIENKRILMIESKNTRFVIFGVGLALAIRIIQRPLMYADNLNGVKKET